jgi:hypothetical protein
LEFLCILLKKEELALLRLGILDVTKLFLTLGMGLCLEDVFSYLWNKNMQFNLNEGKEIE